MSEAVVRVRLSFVIPGTPRPKQRPRKARAGHFYTPATTRGYEATLRVYALQAVRASGWPLATKARVVVWLHAYFPDRRDRDLDNAQKVVDGANGIIWHDDSQIDEWHVYRRLDRANPRLEVAVEIIEAQS